MAVPRLLFATVVCLILLSAAQSQDPLPPDAEAVLNLSQPPEADGALPALEELTAPLPSPPVLFETTTKPPTATEVAGLPEQAEEEITGTDTPEQAQAAVLSEADSRPGNADALDGESEAENQKENLEAPGSNLSPLREAPASPVVEIDPVAMGILFAGILTFLLPVGFALIASGSTRAKNVGHTTSMCVAGVLAAVVAYALAGFALQMGGVFAPESASPVVRAGRQATGLTNALSVSLAGKPQSLVGWSGFALAGLTDFDLALFVRESAIVAAFAAILAGALAERMKFSAFVSLALFCGAIIHPINAAACWGGGWLAALGRNFGLGHGVVDPGGAICLHLAVAAAGMAGILFLGPRYGKYNKDGSPNPIPGHNAFNVLVGTLFLLVGWLGLAAGSALLAAQGPAAALCAVLVGGGGGMISGFLISFFLLKKPDPYLLCAATIAGWVGGSASWGMLPLWGFAVLGFLCGAIVIVALLIIERRLKIDDPTGVLAVHGVAGLIGGLVPGFFARGGAGVGSEGAMGAVRGLADGDSGQLLAQGAGILATFVTIIILSSICLLFVRLVIGLRVDLRDEVAGLDLPELGALGYQPDLNPEPKLRKKK